jgi:hypothetical protein
VGRQSRCTDAARIHVVPRPECWSARRRGGVTSCNVTPLPPFVSSRIDEPSSRVIANSAPGAQLLIPDCLAAFTVLSQHLYRQPLEPAFPIGTLFATRLGHLTPIGMLLSRRLLIRH